MEKFQFDSEVYLHTKNRKENKMGNLRSWRIVNDHVEVLIDGHWGNLVPQHFAKNIYDENDWNHINPQTIHSLTRGPSAPEYYDCWQEVIQTAVCKHYEYPNWTLRYDGSQVYIVENEEHWQEYLNDDNLE